MVPKWASTVPVALLAASLLVLSAAAIGASVGASIALGKLLYFNCVSQDC